LMGVDGLVVVGCIGTTGFCAIFPPVRPTANR
jgi:hypothetical protein